eukprot:scaffold25484_cov112-Isochrysis_galbana.AAC.2
MLSWPGAGGLECKCAAGWRGLEWEWLFALHSFEFLFVEPRAFRAGAAAASCWLDVSSSFYALLRLGLARIFRRS